MVFRCSGTKNIKHVTGDGTPFPMIFEKYSPSSINEKIIQDNSGIFSFFWQITFNGITDQTEAFVVINTSTKEIRIPTNNLNTIKNDAGSVTLSGKTVEISMGCSDEITLKVAIGTKKNNKTVTLANNNSAYFHGELVGKNLSS